jgi:hypothetical protein
VTEARHYAIRPGRRGGYPHKRATVEGCCRMKREAFVWVWENRVPDYAKLGLPEQNVSYIIKLNILRSH